MTTNAAKTQWQYLEKRPHSWRQQLYLKGKKLRAYTVWSDLLVNGDTVLEAADNWDLPLAAIQEVICYCQTHQFHFHVSTLYVLLMNRHPAVAGKY